MIQPSDFVNQAKKLVNPINSPTEVDCRTAVSRAYYYLFHQSFEYLKIKYNQIMVRSIEDYLVSNNYAGTIDHAKLNKLESSYLKTLKVNIHGTIPDVIRRLDHGKYRRYSRDFEDFRDDRNTADYELTKSFPLPDSTTKVEEMEKLAHSITII